MSMIEDKIDFVDGDYENCRQENVPRQIKTRKSSFGSIFDRFTQYRLKKLEKKLEKMKDDALTAKYSTGNFDKNIEKKATSIAELEKKIMVLSKENVPTDYVKRRAIKLKNKMAANLSYNANDLYSVGLDKKDEVFTLDDVSEELKPAEGLNSEVNPIEGLAEEFAQNNGQSVEAGSSDGLSDEERNIQAEIAKSVAEILDEKKDVDQGVTLSPDDVRSVVNDSFEELGQKQTGVQEEVLGSTAGVLGANDVRAAVNETFDDLERVQGTGTVINGNDVRAAVDESFAELDKNQIGGSEPVKNSNDGQSPEHLDVARTLSPEEVRAAVNEAFAGMDMREVQGGIPEITEPFSTTAGASDNSNAEKIEQNITPVNVRISKEEIEAAINEVIDRIKLSKSNGAVKFDKFNEDGTRRESTLGADVNGEVQARLEAPKKYTYTPMTDEEIRQSQIKLGFDEHGNPVDNKSEELKEYTYTPMTDEEIRESQIKLGFDEHGNLVNPPTNNYDVVATAKVVEDERSPLYDEKSGTSLRDTVVVAPERAAKVVEKGVDLLDESKGTYVAESSFIPSEVHIKSNVSTKIEDYNALKEKILQLQKQQALTEQKKASAQREAEEAAAKALQAKKELEASQKSVSQSMEMLKAYTEALEEDCFRNERTAEVAENDARMNLNFVDVQMEKVAANDRLIEEIDSLIGPRAVAESIKTR